MATLTVARRGHSGGYSPAGKDDRLQKDPANYEENGDGYLENIGHFAADLVFPNLYTTESQVTFRITLAAYIPSHLSWLSPYSMIRYSRSPRIGPTKSLGTFIVYWKEG